jgi:hypothetical protein
MYIVVDHSLGGFGEMVSESMCNHAVDFHLIDTRTLSSKEVFAVSQFYVSVRVTNLLGSV